MFTHLYIFSTIASILCRDVHITIGIDKPVAVLSEKFLSVTFHSNIVKDQFIHYNLASKKLITLAQGLTAETYLRVGGSNADHIIFDPTNEYILNVTELNSLCKFVSNLGWKLIFDLNVLRRTHGGAWDPSNALQFIDYLKEKNFTLHYELGNEPDLFPRHLNITIPPKQLAEDFKTLHAILKEKTGGTSMLVGPDVATLTRYNYFEEVLSNISENVLNAVTFHHYYSSSENVSVKNFTDVDYLDQFLSYGLEALYIIKKAFSTFEHPPIWLGETSSTYGGGRPGLGESFAAGFLWLDKLGLAAQMNISVVIRQCLKGGSYSLINSRYDPNPDYWISMVYKEVVGNKVLDVTGYLQYNRKVRVYAHCAKKSYRYVAANVVLIVLNVDATENAVIWYQSGNWHSSDAALYLFQPSNGNLDDQNVMLNGKVVKMLDDETFPELKPNIISSPYVIPPLSYGFLMLMDLDVPFCAV